MRTFLGCLYVFLLFGIWIGSAFFLVSAVLGAIVFQRFELLILLTFYYTYRSIFPRKPWPAYHAFVCRWVQTSPYFQSLSLVFDHGDDHGHKISEDNNVQTDAKMIEKDSKSLLCFHPHGILCCAWSLAAGSNAVFLDRDIQWLVASNLFHVFPFISDVIGWMSGGAATKDTMIRRMKAGKNLALLPGGFEEATIFATGQHRVFIKQRKGFIKYALQYGYRVYPGYNFGEERTYRSWNAAENVRLWLNRWKVPAVVFCGKWYCFFLPNHDVAIKTVVGPALVLPVLPEPTDAQITHYHDVYIKRLVSLFDKHKENPTDELILY